jgi:hypothetical protein
LIKFTLQNVFYLKYFVAYKSDDRMKHEILIEKARVPTNAIEMPLLA